VFQFRQLGEDAFQGCRAQLLHQPRGGSMHHKRNPQYRFLLPRVQVHGKLRHQGETDDGQDKKRDDGSEWRQCWLFGYWLMVIGYWLLDYWATVHSRRSTGASRLVIG